MNAFDLSTGHQWRKYVVYAMINSIMNLHSTTINTWLHVLKNNYGADEGSCYLGKGELIHSWTDTICEPFMNAEPTSSRYIIGIFRCYLMLEELERLLANLWIRLCVCLYKKKGPGSLCTSHLQLSTVENEWQSQFQAYCCGLSIRYVLFQVHHCVSMKLKLHKHV